MHVPSQGGNKHRNAWASRAVWTPDPDAYQGVAYMNQVQEFVGLPLVEERESARRMHPNQIAKSGVPAG